MVKILKNTAFGFIFELENDRCFFTEKPYDIYLNGEHYLTTDRNVVSLLSLKSGTDYNVLIKGYNNGYGKDDICFNVTTKEPYMLINVKDFNAKGDGVTCDTSAINLAIYSAQVNTTIYVPPGEYLVDQILLKSEVDIYLARGAVIRQSINRDKLAILKGYQQNYNHTNARIISSWEGHPLDTYCSLFYGMDVYSVHIYGEGVIDGNGDIGGFWNNPKVKNKAYRPKNMFLVDSDYIEVSGITSRNSASWNIHPYHCGNVAFRCLKIESIEESPNTDGINPENCKNVEIIGCHFSVGDDCIAIKSGKYFMSTLRNPQPTRNVTIRNCYMEKGHGGVVIGSEMSCGVRNVDITQCLFRDTDRGLRIKTRRGRGKHAIVKNITFDNVQMDGVKHCFVVNMFYNCDPDGKSDYVKNKNVVEKDELTPSVKNITVTNTVATNIPGSAVFIYGLPESKVKNVKITNNHFHFAEERIHECPAMMCDFEAIENLGFYINNAKNITMENNKIEGKAVDVITECD